MQKTDLLLIINFRFVFCTLYTLSTNNIIFKKLYLENSAVPNIKNLSDFSSSSDKNYEIFSLLNNPLFRSFTYSMTCPFLRNNYSFLLVKSDIKQLNKNGYLKKYLKKFKCNYHRYFSYRDRRCPNIATDKEINMYAIKMLLLITGI